ncbi:hypothetical protein GCM10010434_086710 [Winogradskya humida]
MTAEELRGDTPRRDEPEQRHLDREDRRLGVRGPVEQSGVPAAGLGEHHVTQRLLQVRCERRADLVECVCEHRELAVQLAAHAGPLAALPAEQERQFAAGSHRAAYQVRRLGAGGQRGDPLQQPGPVGADDGGPVFQGGPARGERVADVDR